MSVAEQGTTVGCEPRERGKLERVCRYMARPPIAEERLSVDGDGLVVYELKHAFSDGTTHVLFEPVDFIARLAALVPRPRAHLVRYHGLFAPIAHGSAGAAKHRDVRERPTPDTVTLSCLGTSRPSAPSKARTRA